MDNIGKPEYVTQNRVIHLFQNELNYDYLGNWQDRENNSNIETDLLSDFLSQSGYNAQQIKQGMMQELLTGRIRLIGASV